MGRKIVYWVTTDIVAALCLFDGFAYLLGRAAPVFAHVEYPQQLRVILGIAKPLGAIALLVPGFVKLKEWAYAGLTFAWICAFFAHYLAKDGAVAFVPLVFLLLLIVSYLTRPENRRWPAKVTQFP
jgi:hypothetical protein